MNNRAFAVLILVLGLGTASASETGEAIIDWSSWDLIVRGHVVAGQVDYTAIAAHPDFPSLVTAIEDAEIGGATTAELLSFYINAYNVLAVKGILDGRSPQTAFGKLRFFYRDKYVVGGERLSLNGLEKMRIIPMGESRIHFAIVCSSASCPRLRSEAYVPSALDRQLDDAARSFINDPEKNSYDPGTGTAAISKIFKWFSDDFESSAGSIQKYIARYVHDEETARALSLEKFKLSFRPYDWSLNGTYDR